VYRWRTTLFVADFHSSYEQAVKLSYGRRFDVGNTVDLTNACKKLLVVLNSPYPIPSRIPTDKVA